MFMLAVSREPPWADAHVVYETTQSLIERGELDVRMDAQSYFFHTYKGKKYGPGSFGNVLAMAPGYLLYKALRHVPWMPDKPLFALTSHLASSLFMAGACVLFFGLARRRQASE